MCSRVFYALKPTCSRTSLALYPTSSCGSRVSHVSALVLYVPCALRTLMPCGLVSYVPFYLTYLKCSRALRTSYHTFSCALHAFVPHVSYVLLCLFSCCSYLVPYVLLCSSSLTCCRCFKSNMLIRISCLITFMFCGSCVFGAFAV